MKFELVNITPEIARSMLSTMENRRLRKRRVNWLAEQITDGSFMEGVPEMIMLTSTGKLINGQHRLNAVILADKPVQMYVATGVNEEAFKVIDTGLSRTGADVLSIEGVNNATSLSAIIKNYLHLRKGLSSENRDKSISNSAIVETYFDNEERWKHVLENTKSWYKKMNHVLTPRAIGSLFALFSDIDEDRAMDFMHRLCTGEGAAGDMVVKLRNKLTMMKVRSQKMQTRYVHGLVCKTWNYYIKGKTVSRLMYSPAREGNIKPISPKDA